MAIPSLPAGYAVTKRVSTGRSDCHITVGFDQGDAHIPSFLILLYYQVDTDPIQWDAIARMDHNETAVLGHDIYQEGVHVDVARRNESTVHVKISNGPLPTSRGVVIRSCAEYFKEHAQYFIDVFEDDRSAENPPTWPDGGEYSHRLITTKPVDSDMSQEQPREDAPEDGISMDELTEVLADATGETPEEIERGAEALDFDPPSEATVLDE
ncbi:MAG: hypothetical protein A07HN63_00247 [uncultured archaeon A07HN63]|nr:MAG: hypothetical protein A07HN63_00247 [uncultured archaeon A07HN63]